MQGFALALAAGLMLGSGPESVSGETDPGLDLQGDWVGVWQFTTPREEVSWDAYLHNGRLSIWPTNCCGLEFRPWAEWDFKWVDEGAGKLRRGDLIGIYRWDGDRLDICCCDPSKGRPTSFQAGNRQYLLILRRQ